MAPIEIDWGEVFPGCGDDDGAGVSFAPAASPPPRARAGAARGKQKGDTPGLRRPRSRFDGPHWLGDLRRAPLQPLAETNEAPKAAYGLRCNASEAANDVFEFGPHDAAGESVSRRFCQKKSPVRSGKQNCRQLELNTGRSPRPVGAGQRKPIPPHVMYSSPCSASFSGQQQRVHAVEPEEEDDDHSFSRFFKRRKEQHQDSSSAYIGKVEDVVLLDDEDMQPDENMDSRTPNEQSELKIYYPSRDDPEAVELSDSDITCLKPGEFLSSPVINYYIQYIKRARLPKDDNFYIFNTYFYSKLEEALVRKSGFLKLRRWWKGVNIFQRAYIILPIHGMSHWSLIIICMPGKESDSGPIILHLDSLGMHSSTKIFGTVKRYLEEEWHHLKNNPPPDTSISESVWEDLPRNIHTQIVEVPQQNNAYDCGIFMLYYTERFIREAPERFTRDNLGMFCRRWFDSEDASELRPRIQALLLEEFESARLEDATSDAASSDGSDKEDIMESRELEEVTPVSLTARSDSSEMVVDCVDSGDTGKNDGGFKVAATKEGSGDFKIAAGEEGSGESDKNDEEGFMVAATEEGSGELKVAAAEEGSGESGGTGKRNVGIAEVRALDKEPTVSTRHDENADCVLSEAATFSDSLEDEDPVKAYSDSSKAEDEEELAIVSPDGLIVLDSCDSDSDCVMTMDVPKRRANRQDWFII